MKKNIDHVFSLILQIKFGRHLFPALIFGISLGMFIHGYWLIDVLPVSGRRIVFSTVAVCAVGIIGYFFLLKWHIVPQLSKRTILQNGGLIAWSVLLGVILFLAGTSSWVLPKRFLTFLLPQHSLEINIHRSTESGSMELFWLTTSLGDVSYDAISYGGWQKRSDRLILVDGDNNYIRWTGKAGEQATIVLLTSSSGGVVDISWDGKQETWKISKTGRLTMTHDFSVPLYASRKMVMLLGILNFIVASLAVLLLLDKRKGYLVASTSKNILPITHLPDASADDEPVYVGRMTDFDWIILIGILILALLLRIFNLDGLPPYTDEYAHLLAAKDILSGVSLSEVYQRSLIIVTFPVALSFHVFGMSLWAARLPGVLFNVLAILPLYLIMKWINRPIAILTCLLYATSPWIIAVARNVREYAYYPFYFYWFVYAMILFIIVFPERFVFSEYRKLLNSRLILLGVILLPVIYALFIDVYSTFKAFLMVYPAFGIVLLSKLNLNNRLNRTVIGILMVSFFLVFLYGLTIKVVNIAHPRFNSYPSIYFLFNAEQQWYFNRLAVVPVIAMFGVVFIGLRLFSKNFLPVFWLGTLLTSSIYFFFFFNRYFRPRYVISVEFWLIPVLACGLFVFWIMLRSVLPWRILQVIVLVLLFFLSFNISQSLLPTVYETTGYMPITEEYHDDVIHAQLYLLDRVDEKNVLISSVYGNYVSFLGIPRFLEIYPYGRNINKDPQEYIHSIVQQHESGWIVLDERRYIQSKPLPLKNIKMDGKTMNFDGIFAGQYIWHWGVE